MNVINLLLLDEMTTDLDLVFAPTAVKYCSYFSSDNIRNIHESFYTYCLVLSWMDGWMDGWIDKPLFADTNTKLYIVIIVRVS